MTTIRTLVSSRLVPWALVLALTGILLAVVPAGAQKAQKAPDTLRDILAKYQGKPTSIGKITKIANDYFVVEEEGSTTTYSLQVVHSIRLVKEEDTPEPVVEVKLLARE